MRVFILERTSLAALDATNDPPATGDRVVYFRPAQDVDGSAVAAMSARGVDVVFGPDRIDVALRRRIDRFLKRALRSWYLDHGRDVSIAGPYSLGRMLSVHIAISVKPSLLVAFCEICRRVLADVPTGAMIVTDVKDGETPFQRHLSGRNSHPSLTLLTALAQSRSLTVRSVTVADPLPAIHHSGGVPTLFRILRSLVGGLRPVWRRARWKAAARESSRHSIYFFMSDGLEAVARALAKRGDFTIFGDRAGCDEVVPVRYDHFAALPSRRLWAAGKALRQKSRATANDGSDETSFNGFDYGPFLLSGIREHLGNRLTIDLITIAQVEALVRKVRPDAVVLNGPAIFHQAMGAFVSSRGGKAFYFDHGLNVYTYGIRDAVLNEPGWIYGVHGRDNTPMYGANPVANATPCRCEILPTPMVRSMDSIDGRSREHDRRRVLVTNYTPGYDMGCARFHKQDRYMLDILEVVKSLSAKGYEITYRPHQGENIGYMRALAAARGMSDRLRIDRDGGFAEALARHDVLVANCTTCLYQALYAGWPTIFHEPHFDPDDFVGLPTATDIDPPISETSTELEAMIEQAFDSSSAVARFPEKFRKESADRFLGPNAGQADQVLADFLADELIESAT